MTLRLLIIACCVLWLSQEAHAAVPPCVPLSNAGTQTMSGRAWQTKTGPEGMHLWWWCKDSFGTETAWSLYCSTRWKGDCNLPALINYVAKKLDSQATWGAQVTYSCDDKATREGTDWKGALCREHTAMYKANRTAWEK